jgi:hypothetical protein
LQRFHADAQDFRDLFFIQEFHLFPLGRFAMAALASTLGAAVPPSNNRLKCRPDQIALAPLIAPTLAADCRTKVSESFAPGKSAASLQNSPFDNLAGTAPKSGSIPKTSLTKLTEFTFVSFVGFSSGDANNFRMSGFRLSESVTVGIMPSPSD